MPESMDRASTHAIGESFRLKMVQTLKPVPYDARVAALGEASFNVLRVPRDRVYLDFGTARGNSGMTDKQLSALMIDDEAYAGSANCYAPERTCHDSSASVSPSPRIRDGARNTSSSDDYCGRDRVSRRTAIWRPCALSPGRPA